MDPALTPAIIGMLISVVATVGGILVAIASIVSKSRVRQLQIRERIAMIEKGLVPPPETNPVGFDRAMDAMDRMERHGRSRRDGSGRHRRVGVTLVGVGLGLMVLIAFAGEEPRAAVGVGGFMAILGLAFLVNCLFEKPEPVGTLAPPTSDPTDPQGPPQAVS